MNKRVREQILVIRETGETNMFDFSRVQQLASERGFFELVLFLEDHRDEYIHFILYGDKH